jgi:GntR family transcriptional regulator/MocR family aminotransferase
VSWASVYAWRAPQPGEAVVRHVYDQLRGAIHGGALPSGGRLPASRALAEHLGVARASVVAAYEQLLAEGYAVGRQGAGTFVAGDLSGVVDKVEAPAPVSEAAAAPDRARAFEALAWPTDDRQPRPFTGGRTLMDAQATAAWLKSARRSLRTLDASHFGYGDPRGDAGLRAQIRDYLRAARGVVCDADQVLITAGTQHALDLACRVLLATGEQVWLEDPGYGPTYRTLEAMGARIASVPVDRTGIIVSRGRALAPDARLAVVTPSHQYPLGVTLGMGRRLELLAWAREAGAWIVEDDYTSEFRYSGPPLTALHGLDGGERVIYVGTLNKTLFPGLRLGFLVAPKALAGALAAVRQLTDRQPSSVTQAIVDDFMASGAFASHIRRRRLAYRAQRDALAEALTAQLGDRLDVDIPDQGLHLIAHLTDGSGDIDLETAAAARGIAVRAISRLYHRAAPRQGLLLGFSGFQPERMRGAVEQLARALEDVE